jgi:hypothetical protein
MKPCTVLVPPKPTVSNHHELCLADTGYHLFRKQKRRAKTILDIPEINIRPHILLFDPCKTDQGGVPSSGHVPTPITLSEYLVFVAARPRSIRTVVYAFQSVLFGVSLFLFLVTVVVAVIAHCGIDSGRSNPLAVDVAHTPIVCVEDDPPRPPSPMTTALSGSAFQPWCGMRPIVCSRAWSMRKLRKLTAQRRSGEICEWSDKPQESTRLNAP